MFLEAIATALLFGNDDPTAYRMGSQWSRQTVSAANVQNWPLPFQRAAYSTGFIAVAGGTATYLGKFGDHHLIATNHHVCETGGQCAGFDVVFPLLGRKYKMSMFVATMKEVDLTILKIDVPSSDEALLEKVGRNFAFKHVIHKGEPLATLGFGAAGNDSRSLTANFDQDCKVFSETRETKQISDPDQVNPMPDRVWSFAHGCDISHGDSGSPLLSKAGELLGIVWTGASPKNSRTQNSATLNQIFTQPSRSTWNELNYGVPASRIPQAVLDKNASGLIDPVRIQILLHLIDSLPS